MTTVRKTSGATSLAEFAAATDKGDCREDNQDSFGVIASQDTFIVVDGCGGYDGSNAASMTLDCLERWLTGCVEAGGEGPGDADPLALAAVYANRQVLLDGQANPERRNFGAALCAARVRPGWISLMHVGDCRVGRVRDDRLEWLTDDHSLVASMRRLGIPSDVVDRAAQTHATVLTRLLGVADDVAVDVSYQPSRAQDVLLLCSDGITRQLDYELISETARDAGRSLEQRCAALIDAARIAGGHDDATAMLVRVRA